MKSGLRLTLSLVAISLWLAVGLSPAGLYAQAGDDPNPPAETVKLVFIHHSSGENWLGDDNGGLGRALSENNYFVSDTNYGWGPDAIGDRTDIVNWPEWFRGPDSERYLAALYTESGQNAAYTRTRADPGGENEIIMFKSCFPNSYLEGNPDDPAAPGEALTVGHAKYIYNDLLKYFAGRPDKLFIVITAPPVQDPSLADNARAFNTWLVENWLAENNYPYPNVAVFDFYNVLTGPNNHHRYHNGAVEYVTGQGDNTLFYPSAPDDDHPSAEGNQKAAAEFAPLLNVFYHRWQAGAPAVASPIPAPTAETDAAAAPVPAEVEAAPPSTPAENWLDDFETDPPAGSDGWQTFFDAATDTRITCAPDAGVVYNGAAALKIDFDVAAGSWSGCSLIYQAPQDWQAGEGLAFYLHADQAGRPFSVAAYGGAPDNLTTFVYFMETPPESEDDWARIELPWSEIRRAEWEAEGGAPFDPARAVGLAFGFDGLENARHTGAVWIDDLRLVETVGVAAPAEEPAQPTEPPPATSEPASTPIAQSAAPTAPPPTPAPAAGRKFCGGIAALPLALLGLVWLPKRRSVH
ncbi:MAG: hypothetical protein AB1801_27375 [Chloroflexota bacterium]